MLDTETKRRIDTCRDILVGKVPDPKSQVEQITVALIYKFMDDMDLEAEEMGGKPTFFTGEYEKYRWSKLVAQGVTGQDMLNTYSEALTKMVENDGLPALFRQIFRNAYLPYRDPETLRSFLREINSFTYDHSERLGDAFEYLLSVLGSQGDAGQFRTPRHIIDFMVEIIDPQKNEVIMDPACGTAGFLISAYKHILKMNSSDVANSNGVENAGDAAEQAIENPKRFKGDLLSQEDRQRLAQNIKGYDISPDMVRLSLVNLYLHGFADPKVEEYDTLTSEDKWTEMADVILANPPFMSPKGGIKPHTKFQVQSKRSEVLFVDYIAEHLTPNGRAAIVVPEGIIFQSQSAYVALRKMLVKNHLAAVISLPAGVFNPYSGVKTSILILDRSVAKASQHVAFFKIENDGFQLGAQRKAQKGSQLPKVKTELTAWMQAARGGAGEELESVLGNAVERKKVAEDGEFNLSAERYQEKVVVQRAWPMVPLGEISTRMSGGTPSKANESYWQGDIPWVSPKDMKADVITDTADHISAEAVSNSATSLVPPGTILCVVRSGILKHSFPVAIAGREVAFNQDLVALTANEDRLLSSFLYWNLKGRSQEILAKGIKPGVTVQSFHSGFFKNWEIPLPPLEVQREIVAEIESYQRVIDGARAVVDNYRPHIPIDPEWPIVDVGEVGEVKGGKRLPKGEAYAEGVTNHPYIRVSDFADQSVRTDDLKYISNEIYEQISRYVISSKDVYISIAGTIGLTGCIPSELDGANLTENAAKIVLDASVVSNEYLATALSTDEAQEQIKTLTHAVGVPKLALARIKTIKIPLPPIDIQSQLVADIRSERKIIDGNRDLITRFEKKIDAAIARVWGEAKADEGAGA
ncbi:N-6 DNA methylase [Celeribacter halophilus]|uniref:N-6 DNA methylase n=1 Tax=Celeribacter halophilus TaxID=576117 RepID=UPI001C08698C|nr:N-6 DNA methylase [Celeribacter halophilus]MBU2889142.1 N-6 DNA methylase [Celeribacter halophilus]MDO6510331.1 N-6 DNA methylase [Celeribacter halophilus]